MDYRQFKWQNYRFTRMIRNMICISFKFRRFLGCLGIYRIAYTTRRFPKLKRLTIKKTRVKNWQFIAYEEILLVISSPHFKNCISYSSIIHLMLFNISFISCGVVLLKRRVTTVVKVTDAKIAMTGWMVLAPHKIA